MTRSPKIWGYMLLAPGRPSEAEQRAALVALGAEAGETATIWADRVRRGKRGRGGAWEQLEERKHLLTAAVAGDRVVIAAPYCMGMGGGDAAAFLAALAERGVSVTVNGDLRIIAPGDDVSELVEEVDRARTRAQTAKARAGKRKRKSD